MLKLLSISINIALVLCAPNYPYVFLLDIGNEELKGTTNVQVRLKITGGSVALRYPAISNGDVISHIRVSGVDFGANLMATVVDGGPGCGYSVIAVVGNENTPYEVVITIDTITDIKEKNEVNNQLNLSENIDSNDSREVIDTSDDQYPKKSYYDRNNHYKTSDVEEQSNFHAENAVNDDQTSRIEHQNNEQAHNIEKQKLRYQNNQGEPGLSQYHQYYKEDTVPTYSKKVSPYNIQIIDPKELNNNRLNSPIAEPYSFDPNPDENEETDEDRSKGVVDENLYEKYEALRPHLAADVKIYTSAPYAERQYDEAEEIDQMFNDEEIHNDPAKFTDSSYFDDDDPSAVEY